jgi:hypothetical protein
MPPFPDASGFQINGGSFVDISGDIDVLELHTSQGTIGPDEQRDPRMVEFVMTQDSGRHLMGPERNGRQIGAERMLPYRMLPTLGVDMPLTQPQIFLVGHSIHRFRILPHPHFHNRGPIDPLFLVHSVTAGVRPEMVINFIQIGPLNTLWRTTMRALEAALMGSYLQDDKFFQIQRLPSTVRSLHANSPTNFQQVSAAGHSSAGM